MVTAECDLSLSLAWLRQEHDAGDAVQEHLRLLEWYSVLRA
jgi:hypothetical protein